MRIQYSLARLLLLSFGVLPRWAADPAGRLLSLIAWRVLSRQRRVAGRNLEMALPDLSADRHRRIVRGVFENLGRLLVEFSHFPDLTPDTIPQRVEYDGLEHYERALKKGRGVLFLTAHVGAWELSAFAHSVYGYPMKFLTRPIDNPKVEEMINEYRGLAGNTVVSRNDAVRGVLKALANNEAVGILIDQNTTRSEGVFADFFGIPASTTPGLATFALRTGAPVVPGFIRWDADRRKHILEFQEPIEVAQTGDRETDIRTATARFNGVIEGFVRRYPDQWLWIHRRWKTRPEGEKSLYP